MGATTTATPAMMAAAPFTFSTPLESGASRRRDIVSEGMADDLRSAIDGAWALYLYTEQLVTIYDRRAVLDGEATEPTAMAEVGVRWIGEDQ